MGAACGTYGRRGAYRVLVGRPDMKRPLARHRRRCEDNIKMDLQEVGWRSMDWIAQRIQVCVLNLMALVLSENHFIVLIFCLVCYYVTYWNLIKTLSIYIYILFYILIYHSDDEIKEMDRTCGTDAGQERYIQGFGVETPGKKTTWKT